MMPIVRIDVPEGHPRSELLQLKRRVEESIARTWAKEHIYVAIREMLAEPGDRKAIVTVDLRPGRGGEEQRAAALYREVLDALKKGMNIDANQFVLLVREFPERAFVVSGGERLPPLEQITPELR
ncbi:MAG: hypothetical protein HY017_15315 [Betaproteobacteria bacterium]|nr:hypothetical protein [Betaproteobacteria bacterium]